MTITRTSGDVLIQDPLVSCQVSQDNSIAWMNVSISITNFGSEIVDGTLSVTSDNIFGTIEMAVSVAPGTSLVRLFLSLFFSFLF